MSTHPISMLMQQVRDFHSACDVEFPDRLNYVGSEEMSLCISLHNEEMDELIDAMLCADTIEIADAIADNIVILLRTALQYGIPLDRVWDEVHRSNMAKVDPATGKVRKREDGKILKPDGWTPPDLAGVLGMRG